MASNVVGVAGLALSGSRNGSIGHRQKSSTGCRPDPSCGSRITTSPVAGAPARAPILLERHDLGARAQRVADEHRALEHQPAVEEVAAHALGRPCGLADRDVADQVGVRQQPVAAGHEATQRLVQRQPQPVAGDRLVQSGMAGTRASAPGASSKTWPTAKSSNHGPPTRPPRRRSCLRHAPATGAGRQPGARAARPASACLRMASSIISPSSSPRHGQLGPASQRRDDRTRTLNLLGVGENVALSVSSWSDGSPTCRRIQALRACAAHACRPATSPHRRCGPSIACNPAARAATSTVSCAKLQRSGGSIVGWPAQRRPQIGIAEDQRLQARTGLPDVAGPAQPGRRLDQRLQPIPTRLPPSQSSSPARQNVLRPLHLGHDQRSICAPASSANSTTSRSPQGLARG